VPNYTIAVCRFAYDGWERVEILRFILECVEHTKNDKVYHIPMIGMFPTSCARNKAVELARERDCDYLYMIDDDTVPADGFFQLTYNYLKDNPPCVIGAPYLTSGAENKVTAFEFQHKNETTGQWHVENINRYDAIQRSGIQKVANIGTGCVAYNMKVFDAQGVKKPYYNYGYSVDGTSCIESEDTSAHRQMYFAGIPIFCTWDHWALHSKETLLSKPAKITEDGIFNSYLEQARYVREVDIGDD
jgi:hypothetical protein